MTNLDTKVSTQNYESKLEGLSLFLCYTHYNAFSPIFISIFIFSL